MWWNINKGGLYIYGCWMWCRKGNPPFVRARNVSFYTLLSYWFRVLISPCSPPYQWNGSRKMIATGGLCIRSTWAISAKHFSRRWEKMMWMGGKGYQLSNKEEKGGGGIGRNPSLERLAALYRQPISSMYHRYTVEAEDAKYFRKTERKAVPDYIVVCIYTVRLYRLILSKRRARTLYIWYCTCSKT